MRYGPSDVAPRVRGKILVVDDEPLITRAIGMVLRDHDVHCENTAQGALVRIARGEHFDVILCDLMMPEMNGMEFFERLGNTWPEAAARVIFITGGATEPTIRTFLARTPNPSIDKPPDIDALRELIRDRLVAARTVATHAAAIPESGAQKRLGAR